jgi:hypothetical protein
MLDLFGYYNAEGFLAGAVRAINRQIIFKKNQPEFVSLVLQVMAVLDFFDSGSLDPLYAGYLFQGHGEPFFTAVVE